MRTTTQSLAALLALLLLLASAMADRFSDQPNSPAGTHSRSPELLAQLLSDRDALNAELAAATSEEEQNTINERIRALEQQIDQVGGQLYCSRSRLFWYTDLEAAKAAARQTGRPILSLRLLGKLTDELSCANSRFFRTTLYANQDVSQRMRENFVLHWETVRPVPMLTIDFGDGRKVVRTVTGNSIHYVLTPQGEVVDALPGLFGPATFLRLLDQSQAIARAVGDLSPEARPAAIADYHQRRAAEIAAAWDSDLRRLNDAENLPPEATAGYQPESADEDLWVRLAVLHAEDAELDANSRMLIASQNPTATEAGLRAMTKVRVESPLVRVFRELQSSIAQDSVRNEYHLHRRIHEWFAGGFAPADLRELNEKIYAELFLTPSSDPWLGLIPADTYTGLQDNGLVSSEG